MGHSLTGLFRPGTTVYLKDQYSENTVKEQVILESMGTYGDNVLKQGHIYSMNINNINSRLSPDLSPVLSVR